MKQKKKEIKTEKMNPPPNEGGSDSGELLKDSDDLLSSIDGLLKQAQTELDKKKKPREEGGSCYC